jgi:asparagine synthase (glutamine-hydrolysing)
VRADAVEILPEVVRHYGEPFADPAAVPSFYLSRFAREHVTVALNGDGGDESFAGYQRYTTNLLLSKLDWLPGPVRAAGARAGERACRGADPANPRARLGRLLVASARERTDRYLAQRSVFNETQRAQLYTPDYAAQLGPWRSSELVLDPWRRASGTELLDQLLEVDVGGYLPDDLLTKIDIATMAHSLEGRSPLLDHELMEFAAALPAGAKAHGLGRKRILRSTLRGWVPDEILDGPKRGFQLPLREWFRGELREYAREVLLDEGARSRGWCQEQAVRRMLDEHAAGERDHGRGIWTLLSLELWYAQLDSAGRPDSSPQVLAAA